MRLRGADLAAGAQSRGAAGQGQQADGASALRACAWREGGGVGPSADGRAGEAGSAAAEWGVEPGMGAQRRSALRCAHPARPLRRERTGVTGTGAVSWVWKKIFLSNGLNGLLGYVGPYPCSP